MGNVKWVLYVALTVLSTTFTTTLLKFRAVTTNIRSVETEIWRPVAWTTWNQQDYTTDDVPPELPVALGKVALQVQESVHYGFNSSAAEVEWGVLQDTLPGEGSVRLGKSNRVFMVSAFHQLHCVQTLYDEIAGKYPGGEYAGHLDHCVDYLRQVILCRPDLTLERGDFTKRDFGNDRLGAIHTCSDWNELYDVVKRDWTRWTTAT